MKALSRVLEYLLATAWAISSAAADPPTFERDVRPLLKKRCVVCHNARKRGDLDVSGGLALDSFEAVLKGTDEHPVVQPGKSASSELLKRLTDADEDKRMPLLDEPLPDRDQQLLRRWIDEGAQQGTASADVASEPSRPKRVIHRDLDVVIPVDVKIPGGIDGIKEGGPVEVVLKIGPLPGVSALAFRGDGRLLAVGTHGAVVIWDLVEGSPALTLSEVPGPVHALAFSRDGKRLAVGSGLPARSGSVRIYDVPGGSLIHDFEGHGDVVFGLAFRPDGGQLASSSFDQTVRLWDLGIGRAAGVFHGHSDFVYDVAYARDGRTLYSAAKDRSIKRIDTAKLEELRTYSDHNDDVLTVAVQPGGDQFVSAGNEPQLRWWTADAEKPARRVGGHSGPVHQLAFSGDGSRLISASGDSSVRLWDGRTGTAQRTLAGPTEWQYAVALSDDARLAGAGGWDGLVRVWDADSGTLRATLLQPPSADPVTREWLAVAPSGYYVATTVMDRLVRWRVAGADVSTDKARILFARPEELAHSLRGESVAPL